MTITLPATDDLAAIHAAIAATDGVPPWYGRNLDALYDLLTAGDWEVVVPPLPVNAATDRLRATLVEAAAANPGLRLVEAPG